MALLRCAQNTQAGTAFEEQIHDDQVALVDGQPLQCTIFVVGADQDKMGARPGVVAQAGGTRVRIIHVRHQVGDLLDRFDSLQCRESVDECGSVVFAGTVDATAFKPSCSFSREIVKRINEPLECGRTCFLFYVLLKRYI